jgi:tetratricopeptide (TPR) repeat protein
MIRRFSSFAVVAIVALAAPARPYAQSADLVLCDRVAADPSDPDKPADVKGVPEVAASDIATAIKYCRNAANASRRAMYQLGRAYAANRQMPEAIAAWRKASDKGSTSAMVELGVLYGTGAGVARDEAQARKLFERAAEAGNPRGISNLAALSGGGAPSDPARARELLSKAAETNPEAQYQLGMMLAEGNGGSKDDAAARALFEWRRRKIIPVHSSGWGRFHRRAAADRRIPTPPNPITSAPQRSAMKTPRRRWSGCDVLTRSRTSAATW